jgi:hypothetical protein
LQESINEGTFSHITSAKKDKLLRWNITFMRDIFFNIGNIANSMDFVNGKLFQRRLLKELTIQKGKHNIIGFL